jgi:glycosyltransferase involved in cell wall biosynthesis
MKILLAEFTSAISGAERSLLELICGLREDHELILACPAGPLAQRATELGVLVRHIPPSQLTFRLHPRHTLRGLADMARAARALRSIARATRPSVIHANSIRAGLLAIPAARSTCPLVVHCRDALPGGFIGSAVRFAVLTGAEHVVAISKSVAASLAGERWAERPVTVIHNAVDLARFDPGALSVAESRAELDLTGAVVLSIIAQITPWKGQDLAIRVLGELRRRSADAALLVVGEAKFVGAATRYDNRAFERELRSLAIELGLDAHVHFLGERSDPERILAATSVLLVPSTEEPFGRTIIEAMAMGVPVAATSIGGPQEILGDRIGGELVRTRHAASWADAVERLAGRTSSERAAAREVATARFSRDRHTAAVLNVYANVVGGGKPPDARR